MDESELKLDLSFTTKELIILVSRQNWILIFSEQNQNQQRYAKEKIIHSKVFTSYFKWNIYKRKSIKRIDKQKQAISCLEQRSFESYYCNETSGR